MKIVAVLGSPRPQGNSSTLARAFLIDTWRSFESEFPGATVVAYRQAYSAA